MKLIAISKKLFRYKRSRSICRSDPSFGSGTTSSESLESSSSPPNHGKSHAGEKINGSATPKSVLPTHSHEITSADVWSQISPDFELMQAFKLIDRDGDGNITRQELEALLTLTRVGAHPPSEEELTTMLSEVDRDGDGCITLEEFRAIRSAFAPPTCDTELRDAFDFFDTDHDGKITAEELFHVFSAMGGAQCTLEDCRRMISGVDRNGDGFVCFEDFRRMMEQQR